MDSRWKSGYGLRMCGICGVIQIGGDPREVLAPAVLDRMTDVMRHRGPNDRGVHIAPGMALGARRLSIVDVEGGHQPFANEDATVWAVQNGELYNHVALRERCDGRASVRSRCDTEVIPHLYERARGAFAEELRGKFAIAIWDERRRRASSPATGWVSSRCTTHSRRRSCRFLVGAEAACSQAG